MFPTFDEEKKLWQKGYQYVVGVDEVGRGSFAGPVVTASVVWPQTKLKVIEKAGINDSKQLKPRQRECLARFIKENSLAWDITEVGVSVINRIGIGKATEKAMRKTLRDIRLSLVEARMFVLIDGFHVRYLRELGLKNQKAIVKGDQKSISIASASVLAKVYRDALMRRLSKKYPQYGWGRNKQSLFRAKGRDIYGWARNKGYGTREHQKAILLYGLTRYHRKEFVKTFLEKRRKNNL